MDKCPNCGAELELFEYFHFHDYPTSFDFSCDSCEINLHITVVPEPIFEIQVSKKTHAGV